MRWWNVLLVGKKRQALHAISNNFKQMTNEQINAAQMGGGRMTSSTETLASAVRILAGEIQSPDNVPALCLMEAADRLEQLERTVADIRNELGWRTLERDQALAKLKYTMRRCTCGKCVDVPTD